MTRREVDQATLNAGTRRVLELLEDGRWHTAQEIEEVCQVTAHSRLSDLRAAHYVIDKRRNPRETGRRMFSYRLVATAAETAALDELEVGGAGVSLASSSSSDDDRSQGLPGRVPLGAGRDDVDTVPSGAFSSPDELEDAGWRDLFPAESVSEALPPRRLDAGVQLQLGGMRP